MKHPKTALRAFTLIELLMVIAIIGILAGILIPAVGEVRKRANIAASKSQLSQYVNAIQLFKGEYGYYPFDTAELTLSDPENSKEFIETLSGRTITGTPEAVGGNRRQIAFHSFSRQEFYVDPSTDQPADDQLADRFNNTNIVIVIDEDGDGRVTPTLNGAPELKTPITAYVVGDETQGFPSYNLWD